METVLFHTFSVVLDGLNSIWQPCSENKRLAHLNKLHNFPQQTLSHNDSTLSLFPPSPDSFCRIPQPIWPFLPQTAMANPPLIHLRAVLTRSPRLWGGSKALAQHGERRRHLYYQRGKANGQPLQPDRIGQTRLWLETHWLQLPGHCDGRCIRPEQQHNGNILCH